MANRSAGAAQFGFGGGAARSQRDSGLLPSFVDPNYFSPFRKPSEALNFVRPGAPKTAREIADACRVLPDRLPVSAAQLAARRQDIDRVFFMATNTLAGTGDGLATFFGASPGGRDAALIAGGTLDAAMQGAAPRAAAIRARPSPPRAIPVAPPLDLPAIRYRELNAEGGAQGVYAILAAPLSATTERVPEWLQPPGLQPFGTGYWNATGHLAGRQLGGSSFDPRNFVALTQNPTNAPRMQSFENMVAERVRSGEVIDYSVTPLYGPAGVPPELILMTASGPQGGPVARLVGNPVRARVPRLVGSRARPRRR